MFRYDQWLRFRGLQGYHEILGAVKERSGTPGRAVSDTGISASAQKQGVREASLFILGFYRIHEHGHSLSGLTASGIFSQKRGQQLVYPIDLFIVGGAPRLSKSNAAKGEWLQYAG
jgi:hypothetical protein